MILFDENNLSPVRRRTLERLVNAALKLYQEKKFPTPEEITKEADYAKVTLKSYFSSHSEFIEYVVKQVIGSFVTPPMGKDAEQNVTNLLHWGYGEIEKHEALMRDALRISQQRWLTAGAKENAEDPPTSDTLKKSNRKVSLTLALEPLKGVLPDETVQRLVMLLSVLYGTEALVVLRDTFGLAPDEVVDLTSWAARLLIRQTLAENG